jgi:hypothetical protein
MVNVISKDALLVKVICTLGSPNIKVNASLNLDILKKAYRTFSFAFRVYRITLFSFKGTGELLL